MGDWHYMGSRGGETRTAQVIGREHKVDQFFFFQAEDGIRDLTVTGVQTCALPISVLALALPAVLLWAVHPHRRAVRLAAPGGWLRRGGPRRIDLVQPAAFGHRGQLRLARGDLAAGVAFRCAGGGTPGQGPGGLPGAGGGFVLNLPGAPASAAPASTGGGAMAAASIGL